MAPRALVSRIDNLVICASPKASCRSVAEFAWQVSNTKLLSVSMRIQVLVFRNPFRRLASAYLNKYIEHSRYREASLQRCPDARLDSFEEFVAELDRHGFRCVDMVHFKPQIARYRWRSFDRIFNAEDLESLRLFVNALCGTAEAMPFQVRRNRPARLRDGAAIPPPLGSGAAAAPAWQLRRDELDALLKSQRSPSYASLYNGDLEAQARRIYRADFAFLDRALERGLLDAAVHGRLTQLAPAASG